jgi:glycine/D-amino acid oxidase-like deaminating enzyme
VTRAARPGHTGLVKTDIVVIGAGALGLSTALQCALAGRSVVVVERDTAGSQASGRAAGLFKAVQADEPRTVLARRSIELATTFGDWAGAELDVARSGSFLVARTDKHRDYLLAEATQSRGWGADVQQASPADLAERVSYYHVSESGEELALWCPEDVYIEEPISLVRASADACRRHGVEILESEAVVGIPFSGGRVTGVETEARSIDAAVAVVDAAGAWVRQVAELAGTGGRVAIAPVRHQLLITEPSAEVDPAEPIIRVVDAAVYLRPARGGLMFGGFEAAPLPVDPRRQPPSFRTADMPLDMSVLRDMAAQVADEVPLAGGAPVAEHRGGMFTMSPDGRFVVGPVPDAPGLWVASGCNGSGFSSSPAIGEALAGWITAGEPAGLAPFSPGRFPVMTDELLVKNGIWQYAHYYDPVGQPGQP